MPDTYIQDIKKVVDALPEGLILEEKLIMLRLVTDYVATVENRLENELATCKDGLIQ